MPLIESNKGIKWGAHGHSYGYTPGNKASLGRAKGKALKQMHAIKWSQSHPKRTKIAAVPKVKKT